MNSRNDDLNKRLPDEILDGVGSTLRASDFINGLTKTSKFYLYLFSKERDLALTLLRKLLGHAALGEWEDAESIYKLFPDLLTCRGTIYHPNRTYEEDKAPVGIAADKNPGRYKYVNRTAWQIALMNAEYEEAELMGKFLTAEEKQTQYDEIFPDGQLIKHNWDLKEATRRLNAVFDAVIQDKSVDEKNLDKMNEETNKALVALYAYVKPVPEHHTGLVFDENIYLAALQLYEENFGRFVTLNQRSFWCIRVKEHLASLLGTGYLRAHAQGIGNVVKEHLASLIGTGYLRAHAQGIGNVVNRKGCILADGSSYFAFRRKANSLPGFSFFVGYWGGACWGVSLKPGFSRVVALKNHIEKNQEQGQNLRGNIRVKANRHV